MNTEPTTIAGNYAIQECLPTRAEKARGYTEAWVVLDLNNIDEDGLPEIVGGVDSAVCYREAAVRKARDLHEYYNCAGEELNRLAIREWADEIVAGLKASA